MKLKDAIQILSDNPRFDAEDIACIKETLGQVAPNNHGPQWEIDFCRMAEKLGFSTEQVRGGVVDVKIGTLRIQCKSSGSFTDFEVKHNTNGETKASHPYHKDDFDILAVRQAINETVYLVPASYIVEGDYMKKKVKYDEIAGFVDNWDILSGQEKDKVCSCLTKIIDLGCPVCSWQKE
jgi:hypothetical protein